MPKLIIDRPGEFDDRVGLLSSEDYDGMPIRPYYVSLFRAWELEKVRAFLAEHPGYHFVSYFREGTKLNRFVPHADGWFLGDGDADPDLMSVLTARYWRTAGQALKETFHGRSSAKAR